MIFPKKYDFFYHPFAIDVVCGCIAICLTGFFSAVVKE